MRNSKKYKFILLSLFLICSMFTGCTLKKDTTPQTKTTFSVDINSTNPEEITTEQNTTITTDIPSTESQTLTNEVELQEAKYVRTVDGDTIEVKIEGQKYKVRLIGINTPESVASEEYLKRIGKENTKEGKNASEYTKDLLSNIETVYLEKDVSDVDKYNRLLRYVWLSKPEKNITKTEINDKMLNAILLKDKQAEISTYPPDTKYCENFEEIIKNK